MLELALRLGIGSAKAAERLAHLGGGPGFAAAFRRRSGCRLWPWPAFFPARTPRRTRLFLRRGFAAAPSQAALPGLGGGGLRGAGGSASAFGHDPGIMTGDDHSQRFYQPASAEPTLFSALLMPHRSLSRKGFAVLMAVISGVSFAAGMVFLLMGAWPVLGFFGLDVLAIYWAFRVNFRAASANEEICVTASELRVRRINHRGDTKEWVFNPLWVRLDQRDSRGIRHREACIWSRAGAASSRAVSGPGREVEFRQSLSAGAASREARADLQPGGLNACRESGGASSGSRPTSRHDGERHARAPQLANQTVRRRTARLRHRAAGDRLHFRALARRSRKSRRSPMPPA